MATILRTAHPLANGDPLHGTPRVRLRELPRRARARERARRAIAVDDRFSRLATRAAHHFCSRDDTYSFCVGVLGDMMEELGATQGWVLVTDSDERRLETLAQRGDANDEEAWHGAVTAASRLLGSEASVEEASVRAEERVVAAALRIGRRLSGALCLRLERVEPNSPISDVQRLLLERVARLFATYLSAASKPPGADADALASGGAPIESSRFPQGIVGRSPALLRVLERLERVARTEATVLIEGENGTGKELVARAIHRASPRADRPLVVVNCAAIPEQLLESELFGHERGAFTGAFEKKAGRFEQADGGTVFLDEIGEMPLSLQAKLLRFLQEKTVQRLGGGRDVPVDVRFIAASNRNLSQLKECGKFREDLYFRLFVVPIHVPPLRERPEDVRPLVEHFVRRYAEEIEAAPPAVDPSVVDCFERYSWPGNVRELQHLIQRLVIFSNDGRIRRTDLPLALRGNDRVAQVERPEPFRLLLSRVPETYDDLQNRRRDLIRAASRLGKKLEDDFVDAILQKHGGNKSQAAAESGMHRTLIHRNLRGRNAASC